MVWVYLEMPDTKLHTVFCDVGQGDGALVVLGSFQAVVDTGAYEDKILKCLEEHIPFWDRKIELVFLSHSDKDHVGALPGIRKHYKIGKEVTQAEVNDVYRYGMLSFNIVKGSQNNIEVPMSGSSESNELSVVMRISYGNFSVLFTGDIDIKNELALVSSGLLRRVEVLKVSHHGSKYSSASEFLEVLRPTYSVISVGKKNSYGHPNGDVLGRLEMVKTKVLRTDLSGTVEFETDGKNLEISAYAGL